MRSLTLDEKISIKGQLHRYGVHRDYLVVLTMRDALFFYPRVTGRPASHHSTPKRWRKKLRHNRTLVPIENTPRFQQLEENHYNRIF